MNQGVWYCGNIVVATFLCLNISLLSATGAPINIGKAYSDKSFGEESTVNNRTVQCNGKPRGSKYPQPMYTCDDIRVDGEKLYHGYAVAASNSKRKKPNEDQCSEGCPCGTNEGRPNDIHALCTALLRAHGITESLESAYVVKPSCKLALTPERRVKYYVEDTGEEMWEDIDVTNGYINTLQCFTASPHS